MIVIILKELIYLFCWLFCWFLFDFSFTGKHFPKFFKNIFITLLTAFSFSPVCLSVSLSLLVFDISLVPLTWISEVCVVFYMLRLDLSGASPGCPVSSHVRKPFQVVDKLHRSSPWCTCACARCRMMNWHPIRRCFIPNLCLLFSGARWSSHDPSVYNV